MRIHKIKLIHSAAPNRGLKAADKSAALSINPEPIRLRSGLSPEPGRRTEQTPAFRPGYVEGLIIFDLDGTLVNAYTAIIKSFNYTMRKVNAPVQKGRIIRRAVGWGDKNLLKPFVKRDALDRALVIYRAHHTQALLQWSRVIPGVKGLLTALKKKGRKLAVASNRPAKFTQILIRHLKIKPYFDYVLCADELKHGKPHPEILNAIMRKLSAKPSQTIYVGDMAIDIRAGKRAKVKTIAVTGGSSMRAELKKEKPDLILKRAADLLKML